MLLVSIDQTGHANTLNALKEMAPLQILFVPASEVRLKGHSQLDKKMIHRKHELPQTRKDQGNAKSS